MAVPPANQMTRAAAAAGADYRFHYFSELLKRPVCAGKITDRIGKVSDLVFRLAEPYPECEGIYLEHGWGQPSEFIPMDKVLRFEPDAIFVSRPEGEERFAPFVDQPGWILLNEHLMGRTILDMDGRRTEVVNDVHLLESRGRMVLVHVDLSFNGFLRKWGLGNVKLIKDQFISWRYVQPFSLEDAAATDTVSLSITRHQVKELPGEDLADALEELSGEEQEAFFSSLDAEKAAEALIAAEPRTQRQLVADLRKEKATHILSEMSVPQVADLFSVLPHDDMTKMMELLPEDLAAKVHAIITEHDTTATTLMSSDYLTTGEDVTVGALLEQIRRCGRDYERVSYIFVIARETNTLMGVVDLRELVLAPDEAPVASIMVTPVVSAQQDDVRDTVEQLFAKYHFRMLPIVDEQDHLLGVILFKDVMTGLEIHTKRQDRPWRA